MDRVAGRPVWRCVCAVIAVIATMFAVMVAPMARADDDKPVVTLNEDQKTLVSIGDAATGASYKLDKATVTGASSSYIVVQVDSGYFSPSANAPAGATPVDALGSTGAYVDNASTAVAAGGQYSYITFKSTDGNASITPESLQTYLQGLTFTTSGDTKQNVTVNAVSKALKVQDSNGNDTAYNVTLYNNHAYTFVNKVEAWTAAYADAKKLTFLGQQGHLLTIESAEEHNLIYKSFKNKPGWMGASSFTSEATANSNPEAFAITKQADDGDDWGTNWYWVTGSSAGTKFWQGITSAGKKNGDVYVNWSAKEPTGMWNGTQEGCGQYGYGDTGTWNDLTCATTNTTHNQGFYVEFEGFDFDEVSAASQRVSVTYDLDDDKVTSSTTDTKVLTGVEYSTTLTAAAGRTLDTSSVKVTVGGNELATADYTFESSTGKLTVPAAKVTGDVKVSAKVMRNVTFNVGTDGAMKDASTPLSLSVAYGAKVSSGKSSSGASFKQPDVTANEGKRFTAWLASVDGVEDQMYQPSGVGDADVTSDMTFTAQYKDLVTVTFDYGGGKDKNGKDSVSMSGVKDEEYDIPDGTTALSRDGYTFSAWSPVPSGTYGDSDETFTAQWDANTNTEYTVEHYLQNVDDDEYTLQSKDTETKQGTTDQDTDAKAKTYTGFMAPTEVTQEKIAGDGSTVVKIQYTRNKYDVTFDANGHGAAPSGLTGVKYGAQVAKPAADPSEAGYTFGGWYTDAACADEDKWDFAKSTMPAENLTLFAKWTANTNTKYTVEHYLQNVDDDEYTLQSKDTETKQGTTDQGTDAKAKSYTGFTAPTTVAQSKIAGDGSTVVKIQYTRNKYDVTFDANGHGTAPEKVTGVKYEAQVAKPGDPSEAGYTFGGWYEDQKCTDAKKWDFATSKMPAKNLTLYAKWTPNTDTEYTVEHYLQNVDDDEYTLQSEDTETKQGTTDQDTDAKARSYPGFMAPTTVAQSKIAGDGSTVVKIQYTRNKYDVTFDANGHGTAPSGLTGVKYEAQVAKPGDPSEAGYTFGGWYTDAACADKDKWDFATSKMPAKNLTLYAKWTANTDTEYTVEHYLQNVDDDDEYTLQSKDTETGHGTTDQDTDAKAKSYTGFTAPAEVAQSKIAGDGKTVVKIYYTRNKYDVTFDANGHGAAPSGLTGVKYEAQVAKPAADPSEAGYAFGGWYTDAACADKDEWDFATSKMPAENLTLYAKWTGNPYVVRFDANGGAGDMSDQSFVYGEARELSANAFERDGYGFAGWNTQVDGAGVSYADGQRVSDLTAENGGTVTLYAQWAGNKYDITYNPDGGALPTDAPKTHTYGEETKLPTPTKDGYTFDGWYDEAGNKVDAIPTDAKDMKITAKWTADEYDITYDPNGGTLPEDAPKTHTYGQETKLPTPAKDGYTFDGWYDEAGKKLDTIPTDAKDMKVTAKWTADEYGITYDPDGGTLPTDAPKTHTYGQETKLPTPTRDGYTFDGWYDEAGNKVDTIPAGAQDMKITAKWKGNEYDITYDPDGGTLPTDAPKTHTYGQETKLPTPTRDGYTFDGWYDENGNKIDTIPADAQDLKITAKWTADEYGITYDLDGGTLPADAPKTHTYGEETELPTPTRDGYTFDGWYDEAGNKLDTIPANAQDMKITAKWTKNADTDNGGNTDATGDNDGAKYDPNGGAMPEGWTGADGTLPTPTREGYKFDGWYDDEGNLVTSLKDAEGKTLHARWTKLNTLASTGATALAAGVTALALAAAGVTVGILRRKRSR
ncbi:cell wall/surface repeat protein [Bifidobacterium sp. DSM 109963]|uniref:Cell wall/surface repeat protein n=2 Tax=Bifidobacterium panos TaxID=2675321 RepID=A0ABX1SXY3_9BIFI|nr:cell wall/surface repeat protein [Bifidobacterium sp. DSM 109963]